ncbi:hypothetical protein NGM10_11125 [Halorussus salilacus]|uniref:hypothetical protein n=1 Tax=Halorussus salilacus TaxID=2953750 RepID=UPI00209FB363|nr:hypothetical protein [Halorussus salilacus]USZ67281.1 hypothetical protein NGM10_11125 [Halorussus salilacus]
MRNRSEAVADANVNVTVEDDASAADYRLAAIDALQRAEFDGPGRSAERHRTKALESLDDSLAYVLDANRTNSARLFELDKEASTPPDFAPNVTRLLVRSDERLAETAIADAERANETLRSRNVSFDAEAVGENVTDAREARDRAQRLRDRGQDHAAVSQYRVAWKHAQRALDAMDLATKPNVTIETREDPRHDGNATYTVRGTVFDVRGHELDPLVLSQNGENRSVDLDVNTTPGTVGTFETNLSLNRTVNDVEVSATDPNRRWASEDDPDADGEDPPPETGRDRLRLDADGLPDHYELNVTGTDPLDPDSNSTRTDANESGNGVLDGAEDHDRDGVRTYYEYLFELDPHDSDTDGDGLIDGFEQDHRGIDPAEADTDDDGVSDAEEDLDGDGLTNREEQNETTNPVESDTDGDGLNDSAELSNGTDPRKQDTDDDGLNDSAELDLGTDPTNPDTDDDGVLDGNETFSTETENESVGAAVNVSGEGNVADGISIENESDERIQTDTVANASATEVLDFEAETEFEEANLSLDYEDEQVDDEEDLAMYTYNESLQTYVKLPSSVDADNDTVTGTTPHFSTFVAMNESEWTDQGPVEPDPNYAVDEDFEDLDDWDCEGDCEAGDGVSVGAESPDDTLGTFESGDEYDSQCIPTPDGGCVPPDDGEDDDCYDSSGVLDNSAPIEGGGGDGCDDDPTTTETSSPTETDSPTTTETEPPEPPEPPEEEPDPEPEPIPPSELERSVDIPDDAVEVTLTAQVSGYAEESNASAEVSLVTDTESRTVFEVVGEDGTRVTDSALVSENLDHAAGETLRIRVQTENLSGAQVESVDVEIVRDSDGDGLSNSLERMGIPIGNGERIYTDPYDADTDGDGLDDGEEVGGLVDSNRVGRDYYKLNSDPTEVDSDGDGLDDYEETYGTQTVQYTDSPADSEAFMNALYSGEDPSGALSTDDTVRTDPYDADTDGDGLDDGEELELGTNPARADTDGDGIDDDAELDAGSDPTLHDYEGPEIEVFRANFYKPPGSWKTTYQLGYSASDPSGVEETAVLKDEDVETRTDWDSGESVSRSVEFSTGSKETVLDGLSGTTVEVRASDRHDNTRSKVAMERSNVYGAMAEEFATRSDVDTTTASGYAGLLSGLTVGGGESAETLNAIAEDPFGFLESLQQLAGLVQKLGLVEKMLKALPGQLIEGVQEKQELNNPFDPDNPDEQSDYEAFRASWYLGYVSYYVLSMVAGEQATKAVKGTKTFSKTVDRLDRNGRVTQASRYLDAAKGRTTEPVKRGSYKLGSRLGEGSVWLTKESGQRILSGAKTAAGQARLYRHLRKVDGNKIEDLSPSQEARLRTMLAHTGDDGVTAINKLDKESVEDLLSLRAACSRSGFSTQAYGRSCLDKETEEDAVESVVKATNDPDVSKADIDEVVRRLQSLDTAERNKAIRALAETDSDGVQFFSDISDESMRKLLKSDLSSDTIGSSARKYGELDSDYQTKFADVLSDSDAGVSWMRAVGKSGIETSDVRTALRRVDDIDSNGHETTEFHTASKLNKKHRKQGDKPPHQEGTLVVDFETDSKDVFMRVHDSDDHPGGKWLVRRDTIDNLNSKEEVYDRLALLKKAWPSDYDHIGKLEISEGQSVKMRVSTAGEMRNKGTSEFKSGGATQYMLRQNVDDGWERIKPLEEYLSQN